MQQAMVCQKERSAKRAVGLISLERAPPERVKLAVDNFYQLVCAKLGIANCKQLYVFLLDEERQLWLLCRRKLCGPANWVASALARTMVRGPALIMRSYSLSPKRLIDFSQKDYRWLEADYQEALRASATTGLIGKKRGGPLRAMIVREKRRVQICLDLEQMRRSATSSSSSGRSE